MCVVSNVGDHYNNHFPKTYPNIIPQRQLPPILIPPPSRAEFDALKHEVMEMKKLLTYAKEIDIKTGQPSCEMEDKVALLKKVAELVGVDLGDVFK